MGKLKITYFLAFIIISIWVLAPILLVTLAAFTPRLELYGWPKTLIPSEFTIDSIVGFAQAYGVIESTINSIMVALLTVILSVLIGAPAGYALARFRFPGKSIFQIGILSTRMFPIAIISIPLAVTFMRLGIYDTSLGVTFIHTVFAFPFAILISTSIFVSVPVELEEAAMVLGCSRLGAFRRVILPLAAPGLAAIAIFSFVISWNEVFAAAILTLYNRTLPALVVARLEAATLDFLFASGLFMILPALIFIFIIRKQLLRMWGIAIR